MRHLARGRADGGAVTTELVLITPLLIVLLLFLVLVGRVASTNARVIDASRDAARAASIERTQGEAAAAAQRVGSASLAGKDVTCSAFSADLTARTNFEPGGSVEVEVSCTVTLADLSLLGLPGARTFTETTVEVIDVYRSAE